MNRNLVETIININSDDTSNIVRMLMLLNTFSGKKKTGKIEGIIKLAILDFLIRYPVALDRVLEQEEIKGNKKAASKRLVLQSYEWNSIEAKMMKFNFAPWDFKYRKTISILKAKKLVEIDVNSKKVVLGITDKGIKLSNSINEINSYKYLLIRCRILKTIFGSWSQKKLIDTIYFTFPEILKIKSEVDVVL